MEVRTIATFLTNPPMCTGDAKPASSCIKATSEFGDVDDCLQALFHISASARWPDPRPICGKGVSQKTKATLFFNCSTISPFSPSSVRHQRHHELHLCCLSTSWHGPGYRRGGQRYYTIDTLLTVVPCNQPSLPLPIRHFRLHHQDPSPPPQDPLPATMWLPVLDPIEPDPQRPPSHFQFLQQQANADA